MSKDLISREETMDVIKSLQITLGGENIFRPEAKASVLECLDFVPKVDAEPVRHGRWVYEIEFEDESRRDDFDVTCTGCGALFRAETREDAEIVIMERWDYCPFCGTKMDGGKDNADN